MLQHVGFHQQLESQMVTWTPGDKISPDRMDALVHALHYLLPSNAVPASVSSVANQQLGTGGRRRVFRQRRRRHA